MTSLPPPWVPNTPPAPRDIKPARSWYLVAACLAVASIVAWAILALPFLGQFKGVLGARPVNVPGRTTVHLDRPGSYAIYVQVGASTAAGPLRYSESWTPPAFEFTVTPFGGEQPLPLGEGDRRMRLNLGGRSYQPTQTFKLDQPGDIVITASVPGPEGGRLPDVRVGPNIETGQLLNLAGRGMITAAVAILGIGGAIAIFVVVLVKRSRAKRLASRPVIPPPLPNAL